MFHVHACCSTFEGEETRHQFCAKICLYFFPRTLSVPQGHSFPRASLSENCSHLGTNNVRGQIFVHIYAPNRGHCLFILWQGSFEVNPGIPIGSCLVRIFPL